MKPAATKIQVRSELQTFTDRVICPVEAGRVWRKLVIREKKYLRTNEWRFYDWKIKRKKGRDFGRGWF